MSQADELLESAAEVTLGTAAEGHLIIGRDRYITVPDDMKKVGVQYDHNIETVTFDCPRYWDENDMSTMRIYVNYMRSDGAIGSFLCENVEVDATDENIMHFDWTITGNVTRVSGPLSFLVCIKKTDTDGNEENHWNSELNSDLYISVGLQCTETVLRRYPDIITQLLERMDTCEAIVTPEAVLELINSALATEPTTQETIEGIADAYLTGYEPLENAVKTTVDSYLDTSDNFTTQVNTRVDNYLDTSTAVGDAVDGYLDTSNYFTTKVQGGVDAYIGSTTVVGDAVNLYLDSGTILTDAVDSAVDAYFVENPVNIETDATLSESGKPADAATVGEVLVDTVSYNLIPYPYTTPSTTINGVTFVTNDDGSITANGTATDVINYHPNNYTNIEPGTYFFSGCPSGGSSSTYELTLAYDGTNQWRDYDSGVACTIDTSKSYVANIVIRAGVTVTDLTFKPMLVKGTEAKPFEKHFNSVRELNERLTDYTIQSTDDLSLVTVNGYLVDALVVKEIMAKLGGCWIDFTDAEGNATTEPYIHWYADDGTGV